MCFEQEFRQLNEEWISSSFVLEEEDKVVLQFPQKFIIDKGGSVIFALHKGHVVGCCALLVHDIDTCELSKMVVLPSLRGKGIGFLLGSAFIEKARERRFQRIVLEANTKMEASISLYRKLGFQEVIYNGLISSHKLHDRCDIFMELILPSTHEPEFYI